MTEDQCRPLPGHDPAAYLTAYVREVTLGAEDRAVVFDRYHTPEFVLYHDGLPLDRAKLISHAGTARRRATGVEVAVHAALRSADQVAARYTLTATMRGGSTIATEIAMFGRLAPDGRLREIHQISRTPPSG